MTTPTTPGPFCARCGYLPAMHAPIYQGDGEVCAAFVAALPVVVMADTDLRPDVADAAAGVA